MEAQQAQLDALSNDIANMDTPGYQAEEVGFQSLLSSPDTYSGVNSNAIGTGAAAGVMGYSQAQGTIATTGAPLDVAITGDGYLEVRQANGQIGLTRNGVLQLNANGQLTTNLGMPVVPSITVPKGTSASDVQIAANGTVTVGARKLGQLSVVSVPAPNGLLPSGNSVFSVTAASGAPRKASGVTLQQGALEQSNVDVNTVMSEMVEAQQSYDLAAKAISFEQQMGQIASTVKQ
jgi:flagellar basal-body rod protein FlgG